MPNRVLQWSPFDSSLFTTYDSGKLKLFRISCPEGEERSAAVQKIRPPTGRSEVTTLDWFPHVSNPELVVVGNSAGQITLVDWANDRDTTISKQSKYGPRPCTEVAWNKQIMGQLAAGFDRLRSEDCTCVYDVESALLTPDSHMQLSATHKFSFGDACVSLNWMLQNPNLLAVGTNTGWIRVYDLRKGHPAAMSVMAHTNIRSKKVKGIRSDPFNHNLVATFSDSADEPVKVWDIRKVEKSKEAPVFTIYPHASTSGGSSVDSSKSYITDIEYSPVRSNVLAVGTSVSPRVQFFSCRPSSNDTQTREPVLSIDLPNAVKNFSWNNSVDFSSSDESVGSSNGHHRLLISTKKMEYVDVTVVERQPLAVSAQSDIIFGRGSRLVMQSNKINGDETAFKLSISQHGALFGVEDRLIHQRCASGYSVDSGKNLQALSDELDWLEPSSPEASECIQLLRAWSWVDRVETLHIKDSSFNLQNSGILRLLNDDKNSYGSGRSAASDSSHDDGRIHSVLGRAVYLSHRRSVGRLLCGWAALHGVKSGTHANEHAESARLHDIVHDCEMVEHFERGAALALWHGDLALAVTVLQRSIASDSWEKDEASDDGGASEKDQSEVDISQDEKTKDDNLNSSSSDTDNISNASLVSNASSASFGNNLTEDYIELLSLVAMCIAGYPGQAASETSHSKGSRKGSNAAGDKASPRKDSSSSMWSSMCKLVLTKLKSSESTGSRRGVSYLYAACLFLLETHRGVENYSLLDDAQIAFEDRVAFACTFLSFQQMTTFLHALESQCMKEGDIEGLVITGLKTNDGMKLLQRYVDMRNDIQTAALLVARFPSTLSSESDEPNDLDIEELEFVDKSYIFTAKQFLQEYRSLMNKWQLYLARAALDVELGRRYRTHLSALGKKTGSSAPGQSSGRGGGGPRGASRQAGQAGRGGERSNSDLSSSTYRIPPHNDSPYVLLRCYYCSSSLPVDCMQKQHQSSAWLRKQRPVMSCCPNCKKSLPKCYICLNIMGLSNPQVEVKSALARRNAPQASSETPTSTSVANEQHNVFDYAKWFIWCQNCKHGGHASCIDSWFSLHNMCGVNGCDCSCHVEKQRRAKA